MSSTTDYIIDVLEQRRDEWIRKQLGYDCVDEESEEWLELAQEYDDLQQHLHEQAEMESELEWLRHRNQSQEFIKFNNELEKLKIMINGLYIFEHKEMMCKMAFAHSVTLMESYLGDTLKTLVIKEPKLLENAINKVDGLKKAKYSLSQIHASPNGITGLLLAEFSSYLFHNIPKVVNVYSAVLGKQLKINFSEVDQITKIRHDVVHRDGKNMAGELIIIDDKFALKSVLDIECFVKQIHDEVQSVINS